MYTITLSDGTRLENIMLNGSNFVSNTEITADTFRGKLARVVITGDADADDAGLIGEHHNMELVQIAHYTQKTHGVADGWYFVLREISADEMKDRQLRADVDYAIMLGGGSF